MSRSGKTVKIGVIGGTGKLGRGLALRLAIAGFKILIGSRSREKAEQIRRELEETLRSRGFDAKIDGGFNGDVAAQSHVIILSVPFTGLDKILDQVKEELKSDAIVISPVVPITWEKGRPVYVERPYRHSIAEHIAEYLGHSKVASALHTVSFKLLQDIEREVKGDVIVCADDEEAKRVAFNIVESIPSLRPVDGGPLSNSRFAEDLAYLVVDIGRRMKLPDLAVRFV